MLANLHKKLTLQFTLLVLALLILNGVAIIGFEYIINVYEDRGNAREEYDYIIQNIDNVYNNSEYFDHVQILDKHTVPIFSGWLFREFDLPIDIEATPLSIKIQDKHDEHDEHEEEEEDSDTYKIYTYPLNTPDYKGFLQIALESEIEWEESRKLIILFIIQSIAIGLLVYLLGMIFVGKTLLPTKEMIQRLKNFNNDASHQLKTPLAIINSMLDVALKSPKYTEKIKEAKHEITKTNEMIEGLLMLTDLEDTPPEYSQVNVSKILTDMIRDTPNITSKIFPDVIVLANEVLIREISMNLLDNAQKFTPAHGTIHIYLDKKCVRFTNTLDYRLPNTDRIFDRYYRSINVQNIDGNGLGLSIVKSIIDLHGWRIEVKSGRDFEITVFFT